MGEVNWLVSIVVGIILTIPFSLVVGIIVNLSTPRVQNWLEQRALSTRGKKLEKLKKDYKRVKRMRDDFKVLYVRLIHLSVRSFILFYLFFIVIIGSLTVISFFEAISSVNLSEAPTAVQFLGDMRGPGFLVTAIILWSVLTLTAIIPRIWDESLRDLNRLSIFETYEEAVLNRIRELEGGAENDDGGGE